MKPVKQILTAIFLCLCSFGTAQNDDIYYSKYSVEDTFPKPAKGTNTIILINDNTEDENFNSFGRYLISKGYSFETKDKDFYSLVTYPKFIKDLENQLKLFISFEKNQIIIKCQHTIGNYLTPQIKGQYVEWEYYKAKSLIANRVYIQIMTDLADFKRNKIEFKTN